MLFIFAKNFNTHTALLILALALCQSDCPFGRDTKNAEVRAVVLTKALELSDDAKLYDLTNTVNI